MRYIKTTLEVIAFLFGSTLLGFVGYGLFLTLYRALTHMPAWGAWNVASLIFYLLLGCCAVAGSIFFLVDARNSVRAHKTG